MSSNNNNWWDNSYRTRRFEDRKDKMGLDEYGFTVAFLANAILLTQDDYGDSARELEEAWYEWLHYNPFDAPVAAKLSSLLRKRISRLNEKNDAELRQILERKLQFVSGLADRYNMNTFED